MSAERAEEKMFKRKISYAVERQHKELEVSYKLDGIKMKFETRTQHRKIPLKKDMEIIKINRKLIQLLLLAATDKVSQLRLYIIVPESLYEEIDVLLETLTDLESAVFEYLTNDETD